MRLFLLMGLPLFLLACGQRGPLYMPVPDEPAPPADVCATCPPLVLAAPEPSAPATDTPEQNKAKDTRATPSATTESSTSTATPQEPTP